MRSASQESGVDERREVAVCVREREERIHEPRRADNALGEDSAVGWPLHEKESIHLRQEAHGAEDEKRDEYNEDRFLCGRERTDTLFNPRREGKREPLREELLKSIRHKDTNLPARIVPIRYGRANDANYTDSYALTDDEREERRGDEEHREGNAGMKERLLKSAARVEPRREVVAESAAHPRRRLLQQNSGYQQDRQPDLDIGQEGNEKLHYRNTLAYLQKLAISLIEVYIIFAFLRGYIFYQCVS